MIMRKDKISHSLLSKFNTLYVYQRKAKPLLLNKETKLLLLNKGMKSKELKSEKIKKRKKKRAKAV